MPCKKDYFLAMNNFKNLLIATLTGLLALSLFTLPAQGSKAAASNPVKNLQYEACLSSSTFPDNMFLVKSGTIMSDYTSEMIKTVSYCAPFRPANEKDAKSLEYTRCLTLFPSLFQILGLKQPYLENYEPYYGYNMEQVRETVRLSHDICKRYLPK